MSNYTLTTQLAQPYDAALNAVRAALADQGFGILTEIDIKATLKSKLDVDVAPQTILGTCRPPLAYEALASEPSIATMPCNVVVRAANDATTIVEAFDPDAMLGLTDNADLRTVATDAKQRLTATLTALDTYAERHN